MLVLFELCCCCTTGSRRVLRPASTRRRRSWVHVPGAASSRGFRWQLWGWKSNICNLEIAAVTETFKKIKGRAYSTADTDEVGRGWGEQCSTRLPTGASGRRASPGQWEHRGAQCMEAPKGHRGLQHPRDEGRTHTQLAVAEGHSESLFLLKEEQELLRFFLLKLFKYFLLLINSPLPRAQHGCSRASADACPVEPLGTPGSALSGAHPPWERSPRAPSPAQHRAANPPGKSPFPLGAPAQQSRSKRSPGKQQLQLSVACAGAEQSGSFPPFPTIQTQPGGSRNELRDLASLQGSSRTAEPQGTAQGQEGHGSLRTHRRCRWVQERGRGPGTGGLAGCEGASACPWGSPGAPWGCRQRGTARLSRHSTAVTGIKRRRPCRLTLQSPALPAGCLVRAARIPFQPISPSPEGNS